MLLDEIAARLIANNIASSSGSGSPLWYLWRGTLPDSTMTADRAVALRETGGLPQILNLQIDRPSLQVLVRGARMNQVSTAYQEARLKAEEIKLHFHGLTGVTLSSVEYPGLLAEQEPFYVGEDADQRPIFSCNYQIWRTSTSST